MILFIVFWFVNAAFIVVYIVSQIILVSIALDDRWPLGNISMITTNIFNPLLGDLFFGVSFLTLSITAAGTSKEFCQVAGHYLDGLFLMASMVLLSVMMVYKYWDSITHEDLEFAVAVNHLWALNKSEKEL